MNYYYLLAIVAFIITSLAQALVSFRYNKYKKVLNYKKISGFEVAKQILEEYNLSDIYVVETKGYLLMFFMVKILLLVQLLHMKLGMQYNIMKVISL